MRNQIQKFAEHTVRELLLSKPISNNMWYIDHHVQYHEQKVVKGINSIVSSLQETIAQEKAKNIYLQKSRHQMSIFHLVIYSLIILTCLFNLFS